MENKRDIILKALIESMELNIRQELNIKGVPERQIAGLMKKTRASLVLHANNILSEYDESLLLNKIESTLKNKFDEYFLKEKKILAEKLKKSDLVNMLVNNEIEECLNLIEKSANEVPSNLLEQIIVQKIMLKRYIIEKRKGVLTRENEKKELNVINANVLELINELMKQKVIE